MPYIVNKDAAQPPKIHDADCPHAQERRKNPANGRWSPVFSTYQEAWNWAMTDQRTRQPTDCRVCNPLH